MTNSKQENKNKIDDLHEIMQCNFNNADDNNGVKEDLFLPDCFRWRRFSIR